jgi:hypothetical protein
MVHAFREGFRRLGRSYGLVFVVLATNLGLAAILAVPLQARLTQDLKNREAGGNNLYGFDAAWWGAWSHRQSGFARDLGPEIFGAGFAFRNLELLLQGRLPLGLFRRPDGDDAPSGGTRIDPLILGLGATYLLLQTFLAGGLLGVFRARSGAWTMRGLLHGAGFYFGRLFRVTVIGLLVAWVIFRLNAPFARWADHMARESVSETTALAWAFGRHLLLLLALLLAHVVSSYAKAIVVVEERASALLAWVSAVGFCLRRAPAVLGHYFAVALLTLFALWLWTRLDALFVTTGYKTQLLALLLMQSFVVARIALRLGLLAGQTALYRDRA